MDYDDAYANMPYIPNAGDFLTRWQNAASDFRRGMSVRGRARPGLMYGHGSRNAFDLFLPDGPAKGLVIFVHGGYWIRFDNSYWSHFAAGALAHGHAVAMPSYDLCPRVQISDITRQIAHAVTVAAREVPGPIRLVGHSAGGHLVARMTQPGLLAPEVAGRLARVMPVSPVSDLRPLLKTSMNEQFGMDLAEAEAESPVLMPKPEVPVSIWVGGAERPVFLDQARWLAEAWGVPCTIDAPKHHFDIIDGLLDPESDMMRDLMS